MNFVARLWMPSIRTRSRDDPWGDQISNQEYYESEIELLSRYDNLTLNKDQILKHANAQLFGIYICYTSSS